MNVLTVGSLAHGEGLDERHQEDIRVRPITREYQPSPFSRVGPGIGGATKPDVVDIGGTSVFNSITATLQEGKDVPSAGVLTLHHRYLDRLFTAASGTSYAAPRVAFSAVQVLSRFPNASANLMRALLVGAAEIPDPTRECLSSLGEKAPRLVCGNGVINLERAAFSDDARVVLYAEDELLTDYFAVYRIPIPIIFQTERGDRVIRVTLAYDPPVRHTRADYTGADYTGVGMSFRFIRGCQLELIFEHYRKRTSDEDPFPELADRFDCGLSPGPQAREKNTVQCGTATFKRNVEQYGNDYYLVLLCYKRQAPTERTMSSRASSSSVAAQLPTFPPP